ncbi:MAG: patatin-like phospholipase family protein [Thermochromatium sp.]
MPRIDPSAVRWIAPLLIAFIVLSLPTSPVESAERPRIGLALSGGGARGAAHVGVLKSLEALGVPVDYIAGTSMGSIVGGLYAMGLSPAEIEQAIAEIDWGTIFQDGAEREARRMHRKLEERNYLIQARPGVQERERKVNLAPALIQGQKLDLALRRYSLPASRIHHFDDLRIPFRAVATDIVTGEAVILDSGDLATAMRASMAVPAVFAPVEIGDRLLVDGGLAMNLPVSVVRAMGADIVIAVDVGGPRREREEITDLLTMLDQIASLVTWRNTQEEIAKLGERDLLITPALGHRILASDFGKMLEAIAIGERAAEEARPALTRLALPGAQYAAYRQRHQMAPYTRPTIRAVRLENHSRLSDRLISERLKITPGERLDPAALEGQLARIYDQDTFESVRYHLEDQTDSEATLVVRAREKSWGTSSLQGGLELSSATSGDSRFNIGLAYTMAPIDAFNGEWRTQIQLGEEPGLYTALYQPLDPLEKWYVTAGLGYLKDNLVLFDPEAHSKPIAEYQLTRAGGALEFGRNLDTWGRLGLRYARFDGRAEQRIGATPYPDYDFDAGELSLRFSIDELDSLTFPRYGWSLDAQALTSRGELGASHDYDQGNLSWLHAQSWGRNSLLTGLTLAGSFGGQVPLQSYYRLGGLLNLSGFNQNELSGANLGLVRAIYLRDLGTGLVKTYAGGSLEVGNVWNRRRDIDWDSLRVGGSLFVGADTLIGPLYLGYGQADSGNGALYLFLGRPWRTQADGLGDN